MHANKNTIRIHSAFYGDVLTAKVEPMLRERSWPPSRYGLLAMLLDCSVLTRESLAMSLKNLDRGLRVEAVATVDEVEAACCGPTSPDLIACNITGMNEPQAFELIRHLISVVGGVPLVVLTDREEVGLVLEALQLGVRGYIVSSLGLAVALGVIRLVAAGGTFVPASSFTALAQAQPPDKPQACSLPNDADMPDGSSGLTPRQVAVLNCLREGKANKIIAYELGMCESTVKVHVRNILKKLGATNRTQAVYLTNSAWRLEHEEV